MTLSRPGANPKAQPEEHKGKTPEELRPAARTRRGGGLVVRTLALVRLAAVAGQLTALSIVALWLEFPVRLAESITVVAALIATNIWLTATRPWLSRLSGYHAARLLVFDLIQLTALAYLNGGLANPFILLIVVPVTITATALSRGATIMAAILALFCVTFLAFFHLPLPWTGGDGPPVFSPLFFFGIWSALAVAIVFMSTYVWSVAEGARQQEFALAETEAALAREQQVSALGGLAAAAAHELGSPLNTIGLIAKDLQQEIRTLEQVDPLLQDDVETLVEQSNRCRDILKALSEKPEAGAENPFGNAPLTAIAEEAARGHVPAGIELELIVEKTAEGAEPSVTRSAELLHGLGNLISNAGQYATSRVSILLFWDEATVSVAVADDGPGFPGWLLDSLGEPYLSTRTGKDGHMGLGIFIATTLLDRIGAEVSYKNQKSVGAVVTLAWERKAIDVGAV